MIAEIPEVLEVAVVGIKDAEWGQRVIAMVTLRPGVEIDPVVLSEKVMDYCKEKMASYKKPKEVLIVAEFPLNSTGKIAKKVLRQQLEERV